MQMNAEIVKARDWTRMVSEWLHVEGRAERTPRDR